MTYIDWVKNWVLHQAQTAPIGAAGYSSRDIIIPAAPPRSPSHVDE